MNKFLKKNYKKILIVCLILLLLSNNMYENFTTTQALDAVKSTEAKVNNMIINAGANHIDLKSKIRLSGKWSSYPDGADKHKAEISNDRGTYKALMIAGNKSGGDARRIQLYDDVKVGRGLVVGGNAIIGGEIKINNKITIGSNGTIYAQRLNLGGVEIDGNYLKMLTEGFTLQSRGYPDGKMKGRGAHHNDQFVHTHNDGSMRAHKTPEFRNWFKPHR